MAKIYYVKKCRKDQGHCEKCGTEIKVGDPYKWTKPRPNKSHPGRKRVRCAKCPRWRPSELSFSKMAGVMAVQEYFEDFYRSWTAEDGAKAVQEALDEVAAEVEMVADEYEKSARDIEDGFGHGTSTSYELEDKAGTLRDWADEIRTALGYIDEGLGLEELKAEVEAAVGIVDECPC